MDFVVLLFILLLRLGPQWTAAVEDMSWTYTGLVGQSQWSEHFPECGGSSQSPVDVVTTQTKYDPGLSPLTPLGYSQHGNRPFSLYNNGHTAVIELPDWMSLGGLPWLFSAVQMHLHWGSGGPIYGGSEHTINGQSAEAELHVVHYNSELYPNMSAAMTQKDGLAVLGILIVTGEETNPAFNNIINYLSRIRHANQKVFIPAFDVQSLLPKDLDRYYRYNGSLTTPPCFQSVIWTLFHERVQISKAQSVEPLIGTITCEVTAIVIGVMCGCVGLAVIVRFLVKTIRFFTFLRHERAAVNSSTSSWDVLTAAPMQRMKEPEKAKEKPQEMALNCTSQVETRDERPSPQSHTCDTPGQDTLEDKNRTGKSNVV
ncbi:carbonic anhydrase 14 [Entelurus aequoreus]|uniref:carbonic anhydrase 14 n=1 Tax=Entelurus aequoreus TaxID=161455 RepID=UPI002B1DEBEC|nr:carbonic anhydrase 14 [Entelurus aequoreus]